MDLGDCYRLLGLRLGASFADIKASYRRLAQQYHPDINPGDRKAEEKFIALTQAYKLLLEVVPVEQIAPASEAVPPEPVVTIETPEPKSEPKPLHLEQIEQRLKWKTYEQLQRFLQERRFPQAIALAEALAQRLPEDVEVRQWQAVAYQIWGRALISEKQFLKARTYLKKALKTDPHNKSLRREIERDLQRLEQIF